MEQIFILFFALLLVAAFLFFRAIKFFFGKSNSNIPETDRKSIFGKYSPILSALSKFRLRMINLFSRFKDIPSDLPTIATTFIRSTFFEILVIIIWGLFVGKEYFNLNPLIMPEGREYGMSIQMNYIWKNLFECGSCIFWNGGVRGGAPAFSDMYGSALHPFVIITSLIWGAMNGSKIDILAALITAGLSLWWTGKILRLGKVSRMWMGMAATCGGYLTARMELGATSLFFSIAACTLVIPPLLGLSLRRQKRYAILLGVILGLALLSGQGYMQIGLLTCILPAVIVFIFPLNNQNRELVNQYILAGIIAILIAGVFIVPMAHMYPEFVKESNPDFSSTQGLRYFPLNLIIESRDFYYNETLGKLPFPWLTANYIGWIPVLLALYSLKLINRNNRTLLRFLFLSTILTTLMASAAILKVLLPFFPSVLSIRNPQLIGNFLGPLLIILAGVSINHLISIRLPSIKIFFDDNKSYAQSYVLPPAVIVVPFLLVNLISVYHFSTEWLRTEPIDAQRYEEIKYIQTASTQWVNTPYGEHWWLIPAMDSDLKIADGPRQWNLIDRVLPKAILELSYSVDDPNDPSIVGKVYELFLRSNPDNNYAGIISNNKKIIVCTAFATGGSIDVSCPNSSGGTLVVYENSVSGWKAWVDNKLTTISGGQWLSVDLTPGSHTIQFRYQPWDVWVGMALSLIGVILSIWMWRSSPPLSEPVSSSEDDLIQTQDPQ